MRIEVYGFRHKIGIIAQGQEAEISATGQHDERKAGGNSNELNQDHNKDSGSEGSPSRNCQVCKQSDSRDKECQIRGSD
jgi:hypothetical protein